jgi:hypothetical protein
MSKASLLFHYSLSEDKVSFYMFPITFSPGTPAAVFTFSVRDNFSPINLSLRSNEKVN